MAKNFNELRNKMSPESQQQSEAKAKAYAFDMDLTEAQREMRERMEAYPVRTNDREAFIIVNLLPRDGKRFKFCHTDSVTIKQALLEEVMPDCIVVREYVCCAENEEYVLERLRNMRGVVMQNRTVADLHDPLETIRKLDEIAKRKDLRYKIER